MSGPVAPAIVERLTSALGPPRLLREIGRLSRPLAVIGRWRHCGGTIDFEGIATTQLVFNLCGGQVVELRWPSRSMRRAVRAGSVAVVSPGNPAQVVIDGAADTVQIVIVRELIEAAGRDVLDLELEMTSDRTPKLQAAAAQLLVALASGAAPESIVRSIARLLGCPRAPTACGARGGLAPVARRRVQALIEDRLGQHPCSPPSLGELADAAGLSIHHFGRAFRTAEGETPRAMVARRQIEGSLALLLGAGSRVDDVADAMGFSSPSHFVSAFQRHLGVTPGTLRDAAHALP